MIRKVGGYTVDIKVNEIDAIASQAWYEQYGLMQNEARATFFGQLAHVVGDWIATRVGTDEVDPEHVVHLNAEHPVQVEFMMSYVQRRPISIEAINLSLRPSRQPGVDLDCRFQVHGGWVDGEDDSRGVAFFTKSGIHMMLALQADWPEEVGRNGLLTLHMGSGEPIDWEKYR